MVRHNGIRHNGIRHNGIRHNGIRHNGTNSNFLQVKHIASLLIDIVANVYLCRVFFVSSFVSLKGKKYKQTLHVHFMQIR